MPIDIIVDPDQDFSNPPTGDPFVAGWNFDPAPPLPIDYVQGTPVPDPIDIATTIKDYVAMYEGTAYTNIRVNVNVSSGIGYNPNIITVSGEIAEATAPGYNIVSEGLEVTTTLTLQDLSLLEEGSYLYGISFTVTADHPTATEPVILEVKGYKGRLNVLNPNNISVTPAGLDYAFLRDGDLPATQEINIATGGDWTLITDKKIVVTGTGITDSSTATQTIIEGSGSKTLDIGFTSNLNDVPGELFYTEMQITTETNNVAVAVTVIIFESETFVFNPPSLSFFGVINLMDPEPLDFQVFGFGAFTLSASSWLTLSSSSGTNTGTFSAVPIPPENLGPGIYTGGILLTAGEEEYYMPVTYRVAGTIDTLLDDGNFNFTKDIDNFNIYNVNIGENWQVNNVVSVLLNIKTYDYLTFAEKENIYSHALPFFQNKADFHLGEIVERLMAKPNSPEDYGITSLTNFFQEILPIYRLPNVAAEVSIVNKVSDEAVFEKTVENMFFIAGKKPDNFGQNKGVLSHATSPKRVTKSSKEIFNFVVDTGFYTLKKQLNDNPPEEITTLHTATHNLFRFYFDFSVYAPGDVVTIILEANEQEFSKQYALMPEGDYSFHIAFETQFKTLELLECTGSFLLESDIKGVYTQIYKNLVQHLQRIKTDKKVRFKINTGFIYKTDQVMIDEIFRSPKAWLMFPEAKYIEMIPVDKQIVNIDTDLDLYDYELEFEINRNNDADTYFF